VNGRNIFTDQFVEWMMRDLRRWLGKHVTHANQQNNEFDNDRFTQPVDETATIASETSSVPTRGSYRSSQSVGASYLAQMQFTLLTPPDESAETLQFMPSTPPYEPPETLN
jgi:hypothetical protein